VNIAIREASSRNPDRSKVWAFASCLVRTAVKP
jgi:hypothetical protein